MDSRVGSIQNLLSKGYYCTWEDFIITELPDYYNKPTQSLSSNDTRIWFCISSHHQQAVKGFPLTDFEDKWSEWKPLEAPSESANHSTN